MERTDQSGQAGIANKGQRAPRTTRSVVLPRRWSNRLVCPSVVITIRSTSNSAPAAKIHSAGRWSLLRQAVSYEPSAVSSEPSKLVASRLTSYASRSIEPVARQLLRRYGVVFRDLLGRESLALSWRELLVQ